MTEYIEREAAKKLLVSDYAYAAATLLDEVPAADVVEVRHGRWVHLECTKNGEVCYCTMCNDHVLMRSSYVCESERLTFPRLKYCPNCGAKMDGGADT